MTVLQLNPPLEFNTPKGHSICYFLIYCGLESDVLWGCLQDDGQFWWWPNWEVRGMRNFSAGRPNPEISPVFTGRDYAMKVGEKSLKMSSGEVRKFRSQKARDDFERVAQAVKHGFKPDKRPKKHEGRKR